MRGGRGRYSANRQIEPTIGSSSVVSTGTPSSSGDLVRRQFGKALSRRSLAAAAPSASASETAANCAAAIETPAVRIGLQHDKAERLGRRRRDLGEPRRRMPP